MMQFILGEHVQNQVKRDNQKVTSDAALTYSDDLGSIFHIPPKYAFNPQKPNVECFLKKGLLIPWICPCPYTRLLYANPLHTETEAEHIQRFSKSITV